jgi:hypothetical protein
MRFLSIFKSVETGMPPTAEEISKMGKLIEEMAKAGVLLATEGCLRAPRVRACDSLAEK